MKLFKRIFLHEALLLKRNKLQMFILFVFSIAALYAVYYGEAEITKQEKTIHRIQRKNAKDQALLAAGLSADTSSPAGLAAYEMAAYPSKTRFFLNYYAIDQPSPFSKLSIGQRDIYPGYLPLNAQNLYLQLFKSEISNPVKLLAGNFDFSFVIIYLLPLVVIAFAYNILSYEKEAGTFPLLKTQPVSIRRIVLYKAIFYFSLITSLIILLSVAGFIYCKTGFSRFSEMTWFLLTAILYTGCWFSFVLLINSFNKGSAFNAMCLLCLWLLFLVIIPSLLNLVVTGQKSVDATRLTDFIRRRQGMGETKREKLALLSRFYSYYPEYKNADTVRSGFLDFKAYSAFVTLADREAKPKVDEYYLSILQRNQAIAAFDFINPAVNTQNIFNRISETGLENSFDFRYSVALFHTQVCRFCFTPLFSGRLMKNEDYKHIPTFVKRQDETIRHSVFREVCWLLLLPFLTGIIAGFKLGTI